MKKTRKIIDDKKGQRIIRAVDLFAQGKLAIIIELKKEANKKQNQIVKIVLIGLNGGNNT